MGLRVINPSNSDEDMELMFSEKEFADFEIEEGVKVVVVASDTTFSFRNVCLASLYI